MASFRIALLAAAGIIHGTLAALRLRSEVDRQLTQTVTCEEAEQDMDASIAHPTKLGIIVHRKTGFVMSRFAAECFDATRSQAHHMMDPHKVELDKLLEENNETKYVHFARHPMKLAISNYLYNKYTSHEPGTLGKGTAKGLLWRCKLNCDKAAFEQLPPYADADESAREYLQRVDNQTGLLATQCETRAVIFRMLGHKQWCKDHKDRCMQVYLDHIMYSSEAFKSTFKKIAAFAGFEWTRELEECLSYQDVNSPTFGAAHGSHVGHCSKSHVIPESKAQIKVDALHHDLRLMSGYYQGAIDTLFDW